jgi:hypothetical protein
MRIDSPQRNKSLLLGSPVDDRATLTESLGRRVIRRSQIFVVLAVAVAVGCRSGPQTVSEDQSETAVRLRALLQHLTDFVAETNRTSTRPATEEKFKKYLGALPKDRLAVDRVSDFQELLVSPRDHEPFAINYDIPLGGPVPAIWERRGVGGRRYVIFVDDTLEEVDEPRSRELKLK